MIAELVMKRTPYFAFVVILLGLQYGITGLFAPIFRYLMYPRHRVWRFPPVGSLLVLYLSVKAFYAYFETGGNPIAFAVDLYNIGYRVQLKKKYASLHVIKFYFICV